jgi:ubiquitin-conjugating enzyme E2 O
MGDKVLLKNHENAPLTRHGKEDGEVGIIEVRHFVVRETKTTVTVLWQDNITETIPSTELIPFLNPDEYDCW